MNKEDSIKTIKSELSDVSIGDVALIIEFLNRLAQIEYENYMKSNQ